MDKPLEVISEKEPTSRKSAPRFGRRKTWPKLLSFINDIIYWEDGDAEKIGEGFFSNVFKFLHHPSGNTVVVKVSKGDDETSEEDRDVMIKEIKLLKKLSHQNIIKYFGLCAKNGRFHPVLEFINGGALDRLLVNPNIALSWSEKIGFCRNVAEGMQYLHSKRIFHRDLKSSNCLIRHDEGGSRTVVVADFGLAREISGDTKCPRKMSMVGTAFWMAPELLKGKKCNSKLDVFSYGILVCEILARVISDPDDLPRTSNFGLDLEKFSAMCRRCPEQLLELVKDCTEVSNPYSRPSFDEIAKLLEEIESADDDADYDDIEGLLIGGEKGTVTQQCDRKQWGAMQQFLLDDNTQSDNGLSVMPQRLSNRSIDSGFGDDCADCSRNNHSFLASGKKSDEYFDNKSKLDKNRKVRKRVSFRFVSSILSGRRRFVDDVIHEDVAPSRGLSLRRSASLPDLKIQPPEHGRERTRTMTGVTRRPKSLHFPST